MKLGTKILSGFAVVLTIAILIGLIGFAGLGSIGRAFHSVGDEAIPQIQYLGQRV